MLAEAVARGVEVLVPTLILIVALAVVGGAVRAALRRAIPVPTGLGVAAGLGLAVVGVVVLWARFLGVPAAPLSIVILLVCLAWLVASRRQQLASPRASLRALMADREWRSGAGIDLGALVISGIALAPLMRVGATFWTAWANDFPSYVAYAQVWLTPSTGPDAYLTRHPDAFGAHMAFNAELDHPTVTGWLAFTQTVTQTPVTRLLTPLVWVLLFITLSAVTQLIRRLFGFRPVIALLIAVIPTLSVIPFTRMLDNQLGQGMLIVAMIMLLIVFAGADDAVGRRAVVSVAVIVGLLAAAGLGANYTVFLAFGPVIVMLVVGVLRAHGVSLRRGVALCAVSALCTIAFVIPLMPGWAESLTRNLSGTIGQRMAFPSALSAIGLQTSMESAPSLPVVLATWAIALGVALLLVFTSHLGTGDRWLIVAAIVITIANIGAIVLRVGPDNYGTHKWMALFIAVAMPLVLAAAVRRLHVDRSPMGRGILGLLSLATLVIATHASSTVPFVVPRDLMALAGDPILSRLEHVNIDLGNYYEDAMAAAVLPSGSMTVIRDTYAEPTPAVGEWTLVRRDAAGPWQATQPLNATYMLASTSTSAQLP